MSTALETIHAAAVAEALGLPKVASDQDIFSRIADLRVEAGEEDVDELEHIDLMKLGLHQNVTITKSGAEITLYTPVMSGSEEITTLTMRRPTAKHQRLMEESTGGGMKKMLKLAAELCGKTLEQFDLFDYADAKLVIDVLLFLRRPPLRIGATS